ncbi:uncharacterized protein [Nothobranchius furzeri]|uniref:LOC107372940-like protein n=1 Tax=Nothobranchius furzeri TaxID=105023 RepID=A0A9D2Y936_NOTFU|nr:uncharacterized protein LOC107372940 [Nothobranchius furzeri]KAF7216231.1 putative LOC107372940-like protein [Nothobranchius furzeri]
MVNVSSYFGISCTVTCFMLWIFWPAEATILTKVGDGVKLTCSNNSLSGLNQLTWKMNKQMLFSLKEKGNRIHNSTLAADLDLKVLKSENELYSLVIKNIQTSHTGNYTCETSTDSGVFEENWELVVTEEDKSSSTSLIAIVAAAVFVFVLVIIGIVLMCFGQWKWKNENPAVSVRVKSKRIIKQQPEEIYENDLEIEQHAQTSRSGRR